MLDLSRRDMQPEEMDRPDLDAGLHGQALRALARINRLSGSAGILWPEIRDLRRRLARPVRVLDVATGGGDVPLRLWRKARRAGLSIEFAGCDRSPTALDVARRAAGRLGAPVDFFECDVRAGELPGGYDVVTCSLFLHHLTTDGAVAFLAKLREAAGELALVNDLRRSRAGLHLARVAARLLTRSPVVRADGPRSVAAAFTVPEVLGLASRAGWPWAEASPRWPFRYLLSGPGARPSPPPVSLNGARS
jgi:2-polyprenyl-3-methyl-5-hydroxy-6-metoxy-1,4-benzoquinol methylase